jgi:hypothetical protein
VIVVEPGRVRKRVRELDLADRAGIDGEMIDGLDQFQILLVGANWA